MFHNCFDDYEQSKNPKQKQKKKSKNTVVNTPGMLTPVKELTSLSPTSSALLSPATKQSSYNVGSEDQTIGISWNEGSKRDSNR